METLLLLIAATSAVFLWFITVKIDYWTTMHILGFLGECPPVFLRSPFLYRGVSFLASVGVVLPTAFTSVTIVAGIILWFFVWLLSGKRGREIAYDKYRGIFAELASDEENDASDRAQYSEYAALSNKQIAEEVSQRIKAGF